jgi:glycosyltransferase involved in cell wall biosynthesis
MKVLVTVPVWNEYDRIESCITQLVGVTRDLSNFDNFQIRIAIAEDGSTDGTKDLLRQLAGRFPELGIQSSKTRRGRGRALRDLWLRSDSDVMAYIDADLAMGTDPLLRCLREIQAGADLAIGCRYARESRVNRPPLVWFVSRTYNWLIRAIFDDGILDHQCGLKVLGPRVLSLVLPRTTNDSWFWDTELIIKCHEAGLVIKEVPLTWVEKKNRRTSVTRLLHEIFSFSSEIVRLDRLSGSGAANRTEPPEVPDSVGASVRSPGADR